MKQLLWVGLLATLQVSAGSLTESFDTNARKGTGALIWNIGLGRLHPSVTISNWQPALQAARSSAADFGDGRHGAFNASTLSNFDSDPSTPTIIDLDTDVYTSLQVTDFELPNGYTLRPVGSQPLIIRSLSDVQILGTAEIDCSGGNGDDTQQPETSVANGGTGRCGGGNGGAGGRHTGTAFVAAEQGYLQSGATNPIGGAGGANGTYGGGGGGSLFNQTAAGDGYDPTVGAGATVPGTAGTNYDNQDFSSLIGSAGGGGGGAYVVGGASDSTGAGGGAGGGLVAIYALQDFYCQGTIRANGGNGGGAVGGALGGLGGGGGGGTVVIIAGRNYTNDGNVYAAAGTGGARVADNAGRGGGGGPGRSWYTDNDNTLSGTGSEDTACILQNCGTVVFDTGTLEAITTSIDLQNTRPTLNSVNLNSALNGASTLTVSLAGSNDNFASDDTGWVSTGSLDSLTGKRYVKFRFQLDNQDATNYSYLDAVTLDFSETTMDQFNFGAACGRVSLSPPPSFLQIIFQMIFLLMPYFLIKLLNQLRPKRV